MLKKLLPSLLTLSLLSGAYSNRFSISKILYNSQELPKKKWTNVTVIERCFSGEKVFVKVEIPLPLGSNFSDINMFFANDNKEILQTSLKNNSVQGSFFSLPYKLEKTMTGRPIQQNIDDIVIINMDFNKNWLPEKCTKISASIRSGDGNIYNYYGIRNSNISIPDLMVIEEYEDYKCDS